MKMITVRVPDSLHVELLEEAKKEGVSLNQLCLTKLARPLDWYRQKNSKEKTRRTEPDGTCHEETGKARH